MSFAHSAESINTWQFCRKTAGMLIFKGNEDYAIRA